MTGAPNMSGTGVERAPAALVAAAFLLSPAYGNDGFLLIDENLRGQPVQVIEINDQAVVYMNETSAVMSMNVTECIALTIGAIPPGGPARPDGGLLVLADGQRLPGALARGSAAADEEILSWEHSWLGRVDVPLELVSGLSLGGSSVPVPRDKDVVVLANGDRLTGFITGLGDPIRMVVDLDADAEIKVPIDRAVGLALVTPPRAPAGPRIWFTDGTMLNVRRVAARDGYLRMHPIWADAAGPPVEVRLADVTAILFDSRSMAAFSAIAPTAVEKSSPRFFVPPPRVLDDRPPLGLGRIEYRGPLLARYALPPGTRRFAAEAAVPPNARLWADFELVLRDDDNEVFRRHISAELPEVSINVALSGSELTIELTQGGNGPILDRMILDRALLLVR